MVKDILAIIEHARKLISSQQETQEKVFETVVEPIFVQMPEVVGDYGRLLNDADKALEGASLFEYEQLASQLRESRESRLLDRVSVCEQASTLIDVTDDDDLAAFARAVRAVFSSTEDRGQSGPERVCLLFDRVAEGDCQVDEAKSALRVAKLRLRLEWRDLCRCYAELRLKYLAPSVADSERLKGTLRNFPVIK